MCICKTTRGWAARTLHRQVHSTLAKVANARRGAGIIVRNTRSEMRPVFRSQIPRHPAPHFLRVCFGSTTGSDPAPYLAETC